MNDRHVLDLTAETCPMTFVRTKIALDRLPPRETLLVLVRDPSTRDDLITSFREHGHHAEAVTDPPRCPYAILLRKTAP